MEHWFCRHQKFHCKEQSEIIVKSLCKGLSIGIAVVLPPPRFEAVMSSTEICVAIPYPQAGILDFRSLPGKVSLARAPPPSFGPPFQNLLQGALSVQHGDHLHWNRFGAVDD